jgi:hypothetical protein
MPGLMIAISGCQSPSQPKEGDYKVTREPSTPWAIAGQSMTLSVASKHASQPESTPVKYQWTFNGIDIPGATGQEFSIRLMKLENVGTYGVWATKGEKKAKVYEESVSLLSTNLGGDFGSLTELVTVFTGTGGCCGRSFNKYKVYLAFDGPFTLPSSTSFPNPNNRTNLEVDTLSDLNPTVDTCVMIQQSFAPFSVVGCNDNFAPPPLPNPLLSKCTARLDPNRKYRVGVCFQSSTLGGATTVTWNYRYYN